MFFSAYTKTTYMKEMTNLKDLLKHELEDLYSAEEQIIDGLPGMIEKAGNKELKKSLSDHLKVTREQKSRLEKIKKLLGSQENEEDRGFFARLFSGGSHHCKAMEGLIKEGEKIMDQPMEPEVRDAAIIGAAQKIEHYEISGYGTAKAYAMQLGLDEVVDLIDQTLEEEYEADDLLTELAVTNVNLDAEQDSNEESEEEMDSLRKLPVKKNTPAKKRASRTTTARKKSGGSKKS
jgi:ferritin-like metal-binding protein YciE